MLRLFSMYIEPFRPDVSFGAKFLHAVVCAIGVLVVLDAVSCLVSQDYGLIYHILVDFARSHGMPDYRGNFGIRLLIGVVLASYPSALVLVSSAIIMLVHDSKKFKQRLETSPE